MAVREELQLDLTRALSQIDDLERQLDSLLQPVELPITVSEQAEDALKRMDRTLEDIEQGTADISADLSLMEAAAGSAEVDVRALARALGVGEEEASQMVSEFAQATLEARDLEAATREVSQALGLSESDARDLARQMERASAETREMATAGRTAGSGVGFLGGNFRSLLTTVTAYVGAREFINFARDSISAASDLEESISKTDVVFGDFSEEIQTFANTAPTALGLSNQAALETTATFGNLFTALGLSRQAAADLSPEIVQLGADLASFNNIEVDEALTALRSGLVGEVEPLRRLGVAINAAVVEAKALELGLVGANGEVTEAAKVQARYALILEQTTNAQGDFARTADGIANRQRTLAANFENLQASVGQALLPAFEDLVDAGDDLLPLIEDLAPVFGALATAVVGALEPLVLVGDVVGALVQPFTDIADAIEDTKDIDTSGFEDLSQATQELIEPTESVRTLLSELGTFLQTGLDTATLRAAFEELNDLVGAGVDPVEALEAAYRRLDDQGSVTTEVLRGLAEVAGVTDEQLAGFLATKLLTEENLGIRETARLRELLDEVIERLGIVRGGGLDFARGRGGRQEFIIDLEDINAALERVQFERATGQLEDLDSAFANFDTSVLLEVEIPDISDQVAAIESDIGELPTALDAARAALRDEENEIVDDFGEFFGNLEAELAAQQQFAQNIQILRSLGFDDLADQFEALGIDSAGALADGLEDPAALARAEAALEAYGANIDQQFITRTAEAVAAATDSIDDLIAKINEVDGLSSTAQIQVLFEAIGAIDSRSVFESNIGTPTVPASAPSSTINVTNNFFTEPQPTTDTARINQAVSSVISPNVTQ